MRGKLLFSENLSYKLKLFAKLYFKKHLFVKFVQNSHNFNFLYSTGKKCWKCLKNVTLSTSIRFHQNITAWWQHAYIYTRNSISLNEYQRHCVVYTIVHMSDWRKHKVEVEVFTVHIRQHNVFISSLNFGS